MKRIDRRTFVLLASVGASGAVLTACGNTESTDANLNPTMIPDVAGAPPTLAPQATPGGGAAEQQPAQGETAQQPPAQEGQQGGGQAQTHLVEMNLQLQFVPEQLTVNVGDTVTWRTVGPIPHTSTCDPSLAANPEQSVALPEGAEPWNSGDVGDGEEFSHTFEVPGDYTYFCIPHEAAGMIASLTVQEAGAAPAGGGTPATEATPAAEQHPAQGAAASDGAGEPVALEGLDPAAWSVNELSVSPGQVIQVTNAGVLQHTFAVDEWGIDENLPSGEPVEITVPDDAQVGASLVFYCSVPGHRELGMEGTLTIV
jgi:plastocyanin